LAHFKKHKLEEKLLQKEGNFSYSLIEWTDRQKRHPPFNIITLKKMMHERKFSIIEELSS
jgi:hypothetical protein